ncbi:MAG: ComF family protein [Termitinemataceae bacterium]
MWSFCTSITAYLRELLVGQGCLICGNLLHDHDEILTSLCKSCQSAFHTDLSGTAHCKQCGRPLISELNTCMECRRSTEKGSIDRALALIPYIGWGKTLLGLYKFTGHRQLSWYFARELEYARIWLVKQGWDFDAWVPVPPRKGKVHEVGWDQVALISRILEKAQKHSQRLLVCEYLEEPPKPLPVCSCLARLPSKIQKKLDRAGRYENMRNSIVCVRRPPKQVLLFDDVTTTGATLQACAAALRSAGAEKVITIALFYD